MIKGTNEKPDAMEACVDLLLRMEVPEALQGLCISIAREAYHEGHKAGVNEMHEGTLRIIDRMDSKSSQG